MELADSFDGESTIQRWKLFLLCIVDSPSKLSANSSRQAELKSWNITVLVLARNEDTYSALLSTVKHNVDLEVGLKPLGSLSVSF